MSQRQADGVAAVCQFTGEGAGGGHSRVTKT